MPVTRKTASPAKAGKTPPPPRQEEEGEESLADIFDKAKAQGQIDEGKYEALIKELVLQPADEKGQSVRIKYHIISEGEFQGQELAQFYKIITDDKKPGPGLGFLKRDLAVLGQQDVKFGDLENVFEEIVNDEQLGVLITVKQNMAFTNAYLNGIIPDAEIVTNYRSEHPF